MIHHSIEVNRSFHSLFRMENCIVAGNYEPCHQLSTKLGRSSKGPARSYVKNFLPAVMGFACNHADHNTRRCSTRRFLPANLFPPPLPLRFLTLMRWNSG